MLRFVHLSDSHLLNHTLATLNGVETYFSLEQTIKTCLQTYPEIDFIICTGDISQTGHQKSYKIFQSLIQNFKIPFYCVPGNHDSPKELKKIIPTSPDENITSIRVGRFNLILISSVVVGKNYGHINSNSLNQLKKILKKEAFPIIALHHPPLTINSKWLDNLGLKNKDVFLDIIHKSNKNTIILSGHIHQEANVSQKKIDILATPSTCYQFQSKIDHPEISRLDPKYRYVELDNFGNMETKVVSVKIEVEKKLNYCF